LTILNLFGKPRQKSKSIEETVEKIKCGDTQLKEGLINDYKPFIIKVVSKASGRFIDTKNSDEFSIGLVAFNEAIECFDAEKNTGFLCFAEIVIKRRVVDYIRKNYKDNNVYPLTYFEKDDGEDNNIFENKYMRVEPESLFGKIEIQEEIDHFRKKLGEFGIELYDLVKSAPKHADSKRLAISIARILAENNDLSDKLIKKKTIPMADLLKKIQVNHKTVERNRKFIIAVYLIINSKLEVLQGYVVDTEKGGNKHE
jgi:RNA polymerase sigma factor